VPDSSMSILDFIAKNKEWFFSGIGVLPLSLLITFVVYLIKRRKKGDSSQSQKSGKNSVNLQSKGSITIHGGVRNGPNSKDR